MPAISLKKRTTDAEKEVINMLKTALDRGVDLGEVCMQFVVVIDASTSMENRYRNHEVQQLVERVLALSLSGLDDDGKIQVFFFHRKAIGPDVVEERNYSGYVDKWYNKFGLEPYTSYAPAIRAVRKYLSKKNMLGPDQPPVCVIFVTDGQTSDEEKTTRELIDASEEPIFWCVLGLGYEPTFLKKLDTMGGRRVDNVSLTVVNNASGEDDASFFQRVLRELMLEWLPAIRRLGMTRR